MKMDCGVIAIDGPAASGKSTVARALAKTLDWFYVDSGALYRAVTWKVLRDGIASDDPEAVAGLMERWTLDFSIDDGAVQIVADGVHLGSELRTVQVNEHVSPVATVPEVRAAVVDALRSMRRFGCLVMEGRDIATRVFPDAAVRVFLSASPEIRAQRRHQELEQTTGVSVQEDVARNLAKRDQIDSARKTDPLQIADGAMLIDSSHLSVAEIVALILERVRSCRGAAGA